MFIENTMSENDKKYNFTVDLAAVEHLGLNLYSNTAAALTEIIANAWDADATKVRITVDKNNQKIVIVDNGHGMTVDDLNNKFLTVAYKRRSSEPLSPKGRPVMGRKGIGKLALFSISEHIEITSKIVDNDSNSLAVDVNELKRHINNKTEYHPKPIKTDPLNLEHGTRFVLSKLLSSRINQSVSAMKKRIARRFSIIGDKDNFTVYVNDEKIEHHDRDDFRKLQFAWEFGNDIQPHFPDEVSVFNLEESTIVQDGTEYSFSGWIGTAFKPKDLNTTDMGNINGILVIARGRIFQENILDKISENRIIKSYITGVIEADFLDDNNLEDLATSDRQRVREEDDRFNALTKFIKARLNEIDKAWSKERKKYDVEEATNQYPQLETWFGSLNTTHRQQAEDLISTVSSLKMDKKDEDDRKQLYRSSILAFERLKLESSSHELINALNADSEELLKLLTSFDNYEVSLYLDLVKNRISTINVIKDKIKDNEYENKIRDFIFEHLWLIDPSWERVVSSQNKEKSVHKLFDEEVKGILSKEESGGRIDLSYRNIGDDHIIIELKRPKLTYNLTKIQLLEQGDKYRNTLFKCLNHLDPSFTNKDKIKVVFLIGKRFDEDPVEIQRFFGSINARVTTYDEMLLKAKSAYSDFISKSEEADKIKALIDSFS